MHHQYLTTHDIKFPDQRQYTKPGDLILYNDANSTLTIYRDEDLIGTVHFSKSGLTEFLRLGWIVRALDVNAKPAPAPKAKRTVGIDLGLGKDKSAAATVTLSQDGKLKIEGDVDLKVEGDVSLNADEHLNPSTLPKDAKKTSPRKPRQS